MKPNEEFSNLDKQFWSSIRYITQKVGYTNRETKEIKVPTKAEVKKAIEDISLNYLFNDDLSLTEFGCLILRYFQYRAEVLNNYVEKNLMDVEEAKEMFESLKRRTNSTRDTPLNKQSGEMKTPAFFTGMINMLIESNLSNLPVDYDPRQLITITQNGIPMGTFSRRMDGAFPNTLNPIATWEIKEYYYATTFGSRVADAIYETQLDGMEINEIKERTGIKIFHYLMVDSHRTWWISGRSYLCRIIDLLNMGYIDQVFFGKEIITELPSTIQSWKKIFSDRN